MKVSVEELSQVQWRVHVELPEKKVNSQLKKAYRQLNQTAKVRGFRPGKVPISILKRHYAGHVTNEVGFELVNETFPEALQQVEMDVVSQSNLDKGPLQEDEPFRYSFLIEVKPEIVIDHYHDIPVKRQLLVVNEEEVDHELELRRQTNAYLESSQEARPIRHGDHVVLDFKALTDGKPVTDGEAKGFQLEVGANRFNPDFESKLVGLSKGEQETIEVTFPADYGNKQLAGKDTVFQVNIKDVLESVVPELDDDFAKKLGDFESLEELRTEARREVERNKQSQIDSNVSQQILDELISRNPFDVPNSMVEQELQKMLDALNSRLSAQRMTLEQAGLDEETFMERNRDSADKRVRTTIILDKIAGQEGLEISDDEVDDRLRRNADELKQPYEKIKDFYERSNLMEPLKHQLLEEKVIQFLMESAQVEATSVDANASEQDEDKEGRNS